MVGKKNHLSPFTDHQSRGAQRRHQKLPSNVSVLISGDSSAVAPPVPIPNTAVKRCSPDGSTAIGRARVGRRQNRTPAGQTICGCFFRVAYSSREHAVLGSRRVDGQARAGSGRALREDASQWKHRPLPVDDRCHPSQALTAFHSNFTYSN